MSSCQLQWILIIARSYVNLRWFRGRRESFYRSEIVFPWSILNTLTFLWTDRDKISHDRTTRKTHSLLWKFKALGNAPSPFFDILLAFLHTSPVGFDRISKGLTASTLYSGTDEVAFSKPSTSSVLYKVRLIMQKGSLYIETYLIFYRTYSFSYRK